LLKFNYTFYLDIKTNFDYTTVIFTLSENKAVSVRHDNQHYDQSCKQAMHLAHASMSYYIRLSYHTAVFQIETLGCKVT